MVRKIGLVSRRVAGLLSLSLLAAGSSLAADPSPSDLERAQRDEIEGLKQRLDVVVDELTRLRAEVGVPEERPLESKFGLGPAASKVYGARSGVSIGGYAEGVYRRRLGDAEGNGTDVADLTRAVLYVGYKYSDRLVFNTEIEFEHADVEEGGDVSVEFAALDYLWRPELSLRAGLLLVPMGFTNEIHEPPFYYGNSRPEVEQRIIPTTWRENGAGIFGSLSEKLSYRFYVLNGFDATGFSSTGLRGGRQKGSEAKANDLAIVGRVDFNPLDGLLVGGSYFVGDSGQEQDFVQASSASVPVPDSRTSIWELHAQYRTGPWHLRALYADARVADAGHLSDVLELSRPVADRMLGGYAEIACNLMPWFDADSELSLEPFFRFEYLDTQHDVPLGFARNDAARRRVFMPGIQFRPHPNVVVKLDYRNIDVFGGNTADELSLGLGLVF